MTLGAMPVYEVSVVNAYKIKHVPFAARAWIVRVEPKVQEFATLMTAIKITALKTDGSALMPASWIAMTKGDAREPSLSNNGEFSGTIKPTINRLTT